MPEYESAEKEFIDKLEVFRREANSGIQFFYAFLSFHEILSANKTTLEKVNKTPLFWKTVNGSLQTGYFIVLGRIFDQNSGHNIDKLFRFSQDNRTIFSKVAVAKRKRKEGAYSEEELNEYLSRLCEPRPQDFRRLKKHIKKYRRIYEENYRNIRHKIFAHKELSSEGEIQQLFSKANRVELERLFIFLYKFHEALWQLFYNGQKPTLRPVKYSIKGILKYRLPDDHIGTVQQRIVRDTQEFFELFTAIP